MTSAETPEKKPEKKKTGPKRKWLRRFGWFLVGLFLALLIFHQQILMALVRYGMSRVAASQHANIQYEVEGHAISGLTFKNVRLTPASSISPIIQITVGQLSVKYSLFGLLAHGRADFVKSVEASDVSIAMRDINNPSEKPRPDKLGDDMHTWYFSPLSVIGELDVQNLDIVNHLDVGDFILQSGSVHLEHGKTGSLAIARMKIPGLKEWDHIDGNVTVASDKVTVDNLRLAPGLAVVKAVSAPAPDDANQSRLNVLLSAFGGEISAEYADARHGSGFVADVHVSATKIGLDGLGRFLDSQVPLAGEFDHIEIQFTGRPGVPSSWTGNSTAVISSPAQVGPAKFEQGNAALALKNGALTLTTSLFTGAGKLSSTIQGNMPDLLKEFRDMPLDGLFQVAVADLSRSSDIFTHGSIAANGGFHLRNGQFQTDFIASGSEINSEKFDVSSIDIKAGLAKPIDTGRLGDITGRVTSQFKEMRIDKYALDSGAITAEEKGGQLHLDAIGLKRAENTAGFGADIRLPGDFSKIKDSDFDFHFAVTAPNVAAFNAEPNLNGLNGNFEASGALAHRNNSYDGKINVDGSKLVCGDFKADSIKTDVSVEKSLLHVKSFALVMNAKNRLDGSGNVDLHRPYAYEGSLDAAISDVTVFDTIFASMNIFEPVGGAITANWTGKGEFEGMHHTGQGQIKVTNGRYGKYLPITAEIAATYSPESVDIQTLHVHVDKTDFTALVALHDSELRAQNILLQQGKIKLLQGSFMFPLDLRTPADPASIIPVHGRVYANLYSDEINLETLLIQPKKTSPFRGMLKLAISADGPLDALPANILLRIRNLQCKETPGVAPGNLELNADLKDNRLTLRGAFQQPVISPLQIDGSLPFPVTQILKERKIDERSPIALSLKLDKSPVTIIGQIEPRIRYIEGQMGIDVTAGGTIAKPQFGGSASLDLPAIRFRDPSAPAVNDFKGSIEFTGNQFVIHRFGGVISGGPFDLTGQVLFEKLTMPKLDLRLTSQNALILRNETLTVRADSDLKISGIANAANVTGSIGLTKSRFFRDVEILPISLPGRPAPKPANEADTGFSLKPPFANWSFNVAIKTKDPLLVRGNLANGAAHIDLKLVGTGAYPALDGLVRIDNFVASLPFSRLNIEYGYAYFSPDSPFVPKLDIQGTSSLRDYNIRVYITGTPSDPITVLSSDPPLPQEEIVALLGTGATSQELTSNSDVLAGRAAVLVFQDLYRKIFRPKAKDNQSFLTRFELNPGAIDPRTGRQEVSARFKATDQVYLIGDIDEQGGVSGQVGYLIRFR